MSDANSTAWISCYIYYEADPDKLLIDAVWPFVQRLKKERLAQKFFFIRYQDENGLHIRLRVLPDGATSNRIKRQVTATFPAAKFIAYIPETERYGGPAGLPIAEQLFDASSTAVLQLMTADRAWNYGRALASAMQAHIGMLQAFGVSRAETAALLSHIAQSGQRMYGGSMDKLDQAFERQRSTVASSLSALWDACESNVVFNDVWFAKWQKAMKAVGASMHQAHKADKLILPESPQHTSPLWSLYESYIHMTNNRLGLARYDEMFTAYILQRSLNVPGAGTKL